MFARQDDVAIDLSMQIVRKRAINSINLFVVQQFTIVTGYEAHIRNNLLKPCCGLWVDIAHSNDLRLDIHIKQMAPACCCACELTPHESTPNNSKADYLLIHNAIPSSFLMF